MERMWDGAVCWASWYLRSFGWFCGGVVWNVFTDRLGYGFYPKNVWCENDKRTKNNLSENACSRKEKNAGAEKAINMFHIQANNVNKGHKI